MVCAVSLPRDSAELRGVVHTVALAGSPNRLDVRLMKGEEAATALSHFLRVLREHKHRTAEGELLLPYPILSPSRF